MDTNSTITYGSLFYSWGTEGRKHKYKIGPIMGNAQKAAAGTPSYSRLFMSSEMGSHT